MVHDDIYGLTFHSSSSFFCLCVLLQCCCIIIVIIPLPTNPRTIDLRSTGSHHPHCQALQQICRDPLPEKRCQLWGTSVARATRTIDNRDKVDRAIWVIVMTQFDHGGLNLIHSLFFFPVWWVEEGTLEGKCSFHPFWMALLKKDLKFKVRLN